MIDSCVTCFTPLQWNGKRWVDGSNRWWSYYHGRFHRHDVDHKKARQEWSKGWRH